MFEYLNFVHVLLPRLHNHLTIYIQYFTIYNRAQEDAGRRYNDNKYKSVSRFILHPKLTNTISRSQTSRIETGSESHQTL